MSKSTRIVISAVVLVFGLLLGCAKGNKPDPNLEPDEVVIKFFEAFLAGDEKAVEQFVNDAGREDTKSYHMFSTPLARLNYMYDTTQEFLEISATVAYQSETSANVTLRVKRTSEQFDAITSCAGYRLDKMDEGWRISHIGSPNLCADHHQEN